MSILSWIILAFLAYQLNEMGYTFVVFLLLGGAAIAALTETPATPIPTARAKKQVDKNTPQTVIIGGSQPKHPKESFVLFRPDWSEYPSWWYMGVGLASLVMLPFEIIIKLLNMGKKLKEKGNLGIKLDLDKNN